MSETRNNDARATAGFSLFFAWLTLLPHMAMDASTAVHRNALIVGGVGAACLAAAGAVDAWAHALRAAGGAGGRGARGGADSGRRSGRRTVAVCAAVACAGGVAFLWTSTPPLRIAALSAEAAAGAGLLFAWGRTLARRPVEHVFRCAVAGLAASAAVNAGAAVVGEATTVVGNLHAFTTAVLCVLAVLPVASAALWCAEEPTQTSRTGNGSGRRTLPASYFASLCVASALTQFVAGFTYLPYHYSSVSLMSFKAVVLAVVAVAALAYFARRRTLALSNLTGLFFAALVMTMAGFLLSSGGSGALGLAARGLMSAACDCYLAVAVAMACGAASGFRVPFVPLFALMAIGSGTWWANGAGVALKQALGYDLAILGPIASACIAVIAVSFFLAFVGRPASAGVVARAEGAGGAQGGATAGRDGLAGAGGLAGAVGAVGAQGGGLAGAVGAQAAAGVAGAGDGLAGAGGTQAATAGSGIAGAGGAADSSGAAAGGLAGTRRDHSHASLSAHTSYLAGTAGDSGAADSRGAAAIGAGSTAGGCAKAPVSSEDRAYRAEGSRIEKATAPEAGATASETEPAAAKSDGGAQASAAGTTTAESAGSKAAGANGRPADSARQAIDEAHAAILAPYKLSKRELQVSLLALRGFTADAMARAIGITSSTVKFHLSNAYRKIGIQSRSELFALVEYETNPQPPHSKPSPKQKSSQKEGTDEAARGAGAEAAKGAGTAGTGTAGTEAAGAGTAGTEAAKATDAASENGAEAEAPPSASPSPSLSPSPSASPSPSPSDPSARKGS